MLCGVEKCDADLENRPTGATNGVAAQAFTAPVETMPLTTTAIRPCANLRRTPESFAALSTAFGKPRTRRSSTASCRNETSDRSLQLAAPNNSHAWQKLRSPIREA